MKYRLVFLIVSLCAVLWSVPSLARAAAGDEHWANIFGGSGCSNAVFALAVRGEHVYASGFWSAGPISTNNWIEVWNGSQWSTLPGLFTGSMPIFDALFVGSDLYVCGIFTRVDGVLMRGIARWNGQSWAAIGEVRGVGVRLATDGVNLFMGGSFTNVGGVAAINIARFDGQSWHSMGDGLGSTGSWQSEQITALLWRNGALYAGGAFTNSGSLPLRNLARWNGTQWEDVGGGASGPVFALSASGDDLYVGGNFQTVGAAVSARSIARWNGSAWFPLGTGLIASPSSGGAPCLAIGILGNDVIVGGSFTNAGGLRAVRIARWDGSAWFSMGQMNDLVERIEISGTNAYIGGLFTQADNYIVNHVTRWDGTRFHPLGRTGYTEGGVFPGVRALAAHNGRVYAGGSFTGVGRIQASRIACWDGTNWSALGSGVRGTNDGTGTAVDAVAVNSSGHVFAGGSFTNAGGVTARNIARWDGNNWFALGAGIPGPVSAIAVRGSDVFVGGNFTMSTPSGTAFNLARWNGSSWANVQGGTFAGMIGSFFVSTLTVHGSDLYIGGSFFAAPLGGPSSTNIVKYDGVQFVPLGNGVDNTVSAIAIVGSDVYAGGRFTRAGNVTASRIARWNGSAWSDVNGGLGGSGTFGVSAFAAIGADLYVGGSFTNAGGLPASRIAKWNGSAWSPLGSGTSRSFGSPNVFALASQGSDLYVGGIFEGAGNKPSFYFGQWNETRDFDFVPSLRLSKPLMRPDGAFRFSIFSDGVPSYIIEASSDLSGWIPIHTNTSMSIPIDDFDAIGRPQRFYRARSGPP